MWYRIARSAFKKIRIGFYMNKYNFKKSKKQFAVLFLLLFMVIFPACRNEREVVNGISSGKLDVMMPVTPLITVSSIDTESQQDSMPQTSIATITQITPELEISVTNIPEIITPMPTLTPTLVLTEVQEVVTEEHTHVFEEDTCTLCGKVLSVLRTTAHENTYLSGFLGSTNKNSNVVRTLILRVIFCDYKDSEGHYISDSNCWDVSRGQDGSIIAWYVDHSPNQYYDIYIAPAVENTIIQIHPDASYLFANLENQVSMRAGIYGLEKVEFSRTTNMSHLFAGTQLASDFIFNVDTSNVTDISYMYQADLNAPIEGNIQFGENVDFSNVTNADGMFMNQSKITELVLPNSLQVIGANMFYGCSKLRTVNLPEGVPAIGTEAFRLCTKLSFITLPKTVTQIGDRAFYNCEKLNYIMWKGTAYTDAEMLHTVLWEQDIIENEVWR